MHIKEAQRTLGSSFTWICDDMDNPVKQAFGNRPNSEFVIDPEGKIVVARQWSNPQALRSDLEKMVGPVDKPTSVDDLDMKTAPPPKEAPSGIVPGVPRPDGARAVMVEPKIIEKGEPYYVKLRGEASSDLMRNGSGQLHLAFRLDPLYHVHWNNLVAPIRLEIEPAGDLEVAERQLTGPQVKAPTDIDPREFLIDVSNAESGASMKITAHYFACNDEAGWCKPVTQQYTLTLEPDRDGGRTRSGGGMGGGNRNRNAPAPDRMQRLFDRMDSNKDGKLAREELPQRMQGRFVEIDANGDGFITLEEMTATRGRGRGGRN
jgi:hypothetical protein